MSKVGYVINYAGYGTDVDKEWMKRFGCTEIMEEKQECGPLRAEWNKLLRRLNKGDELVVPKLSYIIRETRQLSYLLEYCRLKKIRLISIHDCIDSGNELFPETQMSDILNVVALLPKEAFDVRKSSDAIRKVKSRMRIRLLFNNPNTSVIINTLECFYNSIIDFIARYGIKAKLHRPEIKLKFHQCSRITV